MSLLAFVVALSAKDVHSVFYLKFKEVERHAVENMKIEAHKILEWKKTQDKWVSESPDEEPESWMPAGNWLDSNEGRKLWQPLLNLALEERLIWGDDEKGEKRPFSLLTMPHFTDGDGRKFKNPLVLESVQRLTRSSRFQNDSALRRESFRNLLLICRSKEYTSNNRAWILYNIFYMELVRTKWEDKLQSMFKKEIIKSNIDDDDCLHHWLMFYWFMDWSKAEKDELVDALRVTSKGFGKFLAGSKAMTAFERRERRKYEWLALLVLCDNGDEDSLMHLAKACSLLRCDDYNQNEAKKKIAFLTLLRRKETVTILGNLLEHLDELIKKDEDEVPEDVDKKGGLANFVSQCLMLMVYDIPSAYDETLAAEDVDFYSFPKGRRMEIVEWIKRRSTFRFRPIENMLRFKNGMAYDIEQFLKMRFEDRDEDMDRCFHIIFMLDLYLW